MIGKVFLQFGYSLVFVSIVLAFMYIVKLLDDKRTSFNDDEEIVEKSNLALGLRRAGAYLGLAIGMCGVLSGEGHTFIHDVTWLVIEGALVCSALYLAFMVSDKLMLCNFDNDKAVADGNVAVGIVEFGSFIGTGLIINGAFAGNNGGILSGIIFFILGQIAFVALFRLYEVITPYDDKAEICEKGNSAAGISMAGMLIALGLILRASVSGPSLGLANDLLSFSLCIVEGLVLLLGLSWVVAKVFLPKTTFHDEVARDKNTAAILMTEGIVISLALIISHAI